MKYKIRFNKNKNRQIEQAIKVLKSWIGETDSNSTKTINFLTLQNNLEEIQKLNLEKANKLKKIDDFLIYSDNKNINKAQIFLFKSFSIKINAAENPNNKYGIIILRYSKP